MSEVGAFEPKFNHFRDEMQGFRGELKDNCTFFVERCQQIINTIKENQVYNNSEHSELKQTLNKDGHKINDLQAKQEKTAKEMKLMR